MYGLAHLEELGYVERVQHPSGGRRQLIRLTGKANAHLEVAGDVLHDLEADLTGRIGTMPMPILRMELAETIMALRGGDIPPLLPVW